jgi:hypothetical protein
MSENLRVLVCGGRDYGDIKSVFVALEEHATSAELIIHGGSRGADALAQLWADTTGVCCKVYPANWKLHGKAAGPLRNQVMIDREKPDLVVAFPGGRGTADMIGRARKAGIKIVEIVPSLPRDGGR